MRSFRRSSANCKADLHHRVTYWLASFLLLGSALSVSGQEVHVFVTSRAGDRISSRPLLHFQPLSQTTRGFRVDDSVLYQRIDGFGASFLEAGSICLRSLNPAAQEAVLQALFDVRKGAGFSAMKTVIAATDFMSAGPYYTYDDVSDDVGLLHFSIARDLRPAGLIPYIRRARRYGKFMLQAPMDYPPDWMLWDVRNKQDVNPRYFPSLARYYLRYVQEYGRQGVFIDYLSPFNEPGIYTKIPAQQIQILIRDHLGPLFAREHVKTKLQVCDFGNREDAWKGVPVLLDDPQTRKYIGGISYHGYEFKDYSKISRLHNKYPALPIWMTEVDHSYGTDTPRNRPLPRYDYQDGDFWGNQIISDLESGASAWIYWNMILDEHGGPYLLSEVHRDGPDNFQQPVVVVNRKTQKVTFTSLYYYLAHFSKFVRPGASRVRSSGSVPGVRAIAFRSRDGRMVVELLNSNSHATHTAVKWRDKVLAVDLPGLSISTFIWHSSSSQN